MYAKLQRMSMYSELLVAALQVAPGPSEALEGQRLEDALGLELAECRRRLAARGPQRQELQGKNDAPVEIALELDYDLALIRLCKVHGIACDARRFTRPSPERRRLEEELSGAGVDVGTPAKLV